MYALCTYVCVWSNQRTNEWMNEMDGIKCRHKIEGALQVLRKSECQISHRHLIVCHPRECVVDLKQDLIQQ